MFMTQNRPAYMQSTRVSRCCSLLVLLLTLIGCGAKNTNSKQLLGVWIKGSGAASESLTFFADGTFARELKAETGTGTGIFQTVRLAKGKWEVKGEVLSLVAEQTNASEEYRWTIKEKSLNVLELSLQSSGAAQPLLYRRLAQ